MSLTLRSDDAVATFLEHVAGLVRRGLVTGLSIHMQRGQVSRVTIEFALGEPPDDPTIETLKALDTP